MTQKAKKNQHWFLLFIMIWKKNIYQFGTFWIWGNYSLFSHVLWFWSFCSCTLAAVVVSIHEHTCISYGRKKEILKKMNIRAGPAFHAYFLILHYITPVRGHLRHANSAGYGSFHLLVLAFPHHIHIHIMFGKRYSRKGFPGLFGAFFLFP